jgi:hypothetical protein
LPMEFREAEARWCECQPIPGVLFRLNDPVAIQAGEHAGEVGCAMALLSLTPEPLYLVELEPNGQEVQVQQSRLGAV